MTSSARAPAGYAAATVFLVVPDNGRPESDENARKPETRVVARKAA